VKIISWNVNSVRLRLEHITRLIEEEQPDVFCFQETKVADDRFPADFFDGIGFPHKALFGNKNYHGVAILSRLPFENADGRQWCNKADGRHLQVTLPGGIELHNFYVPAGGDEPDPALNDKFAHKLQFMAEMEAWFAEHRKTSDKLLMVGDLNVAPLETDVWSHKKLLKVVSHTPVEVEALGRIQASLDWQDCMRRFVPAEEHLYSWWSYRAKDWRAADKGRRLDHAWATPGLAPAVEDCRILKDVRGWETPSDHAPMVIGLAA
jgi:exodeoxyribonuclease-3